MRPGTSTSRRAEKGDKREARFVTTALRTNVRLTVRMRAPCSLHLHQRHAELVSASIEPTPAKFHRAQWTLKQVQGDDRRVLKQCRVSSDIYYLGWHHASASACPCHLGRVRPAPAPPLCARRPSPLQLPRNPRTTRREQPLVDCHGGIIFSQRFPQADPQQLLRLDREFHGELLEHLAREAVDDEADGASASSPRCRA